MTPRGAPVAVGVPSGARPAGAPREREAAPPARPLVFACDAGFAMPLATALRSIVEASRSGSPLDVHVLSQGFSEDTRRRVSGSLAAGSASIRWIPADLERFRRFSTPQWISPMTYARFMIPEVFPETVSRVLYLDADLLVLDDLGPLWDVDLEGAVLGAVLDGLDPQLEAGRPGLEGVPRVRSYFNAGVLLVDLARWREERISERALEYLARNPRSPFSDQDALNVACDGAWKRLDERWNLQVTRYEEGELVETRLSSVERALRPAIAHFVTGQKPWKPSSGSPNAALYDSFRSRTRFARSLRERLSDALRGGWYRAKRAGRRHPRLRAVWRLLTARGRGGARAT